MPAAVYHKDYEIHYSRLTRNPFYVYFNEQTCYYTSIESAVEGINRYLAEKEFQKKLSDTLDEKG